MTLILANMDQIGNIELKKDIFWDDWFGHCLESGLLQREKYQFDNYNWYMWRIQGVTKWLDSPFAVEDSGPGREGKNSNN